MIVIETETRYRETRDERIRRRVSGVYDLLREQKPHNVRAGNVFVSVENAGVSYDGEHGVFWVFFFVVNQHEYTISEIKTHGRRETAGVRQRFTRAANIVQHAERHCRAVGVCVVGRPTSYFSLRLSIIEMTQTSVFTAGGFRPFLSGVRGGRTSQNRP